MTRTRNALIASATLALLAAPLAAQGGRGPTRGNVRLDGDFGLQANGDGIAKIVVRFSPADYTRQKAQNPNAFRYVKDFTSGRSDVEMADTSARYEDAKSSVVLKMTQRGAVRNLGNGRWSLQFVRGTDFVNLAKTDTGTIGYFVEFGTWKDGTAYKGQVRYHLPQGATDARWNANQRTLSYSLEQRGRRRPRRPVPEAARQGPADELPLQGLRPRQ